MINFQYVGEWSSGTTYNEGALAYYSADRCWYICRKNNTSGSAKSPHNTLYWGRASQSVSEAAEIAKDACYIISSADSRQENLERWARQLVSTTAAGTATKTVTASSGWPMTDGLLVGVTFQNANTASSPKLKINNETFTIDLGTHEATEIEGYCLFIISKPSNSSTMKARFLGGSYT